MLTELTFLRPAWFFALIPLFLLVGFLWLKETNSSSWHKLISEKYHPYLLGKSTNKANLGVYFLSLAWLLAILALTGPSLYKQPLAAQKTQAGSVIVLDLSLSMLADDLKPNRLTRVHFLLKDLLKNHPELTVGMVGYSGTAHIISPLAEDNSTLSNLVSHLNPLIMPSYGADAVSAFELANQLLENSQITQGHLIWITDDLEEDEVNPIRNLIKKHDLSLSLVAVGTDSGSPIKLPEEGLLKDQDGKIINAKPPFELLKKLARSLNADYQQLTQAPPSYSKLLPKALAERVQDEDEKENFQAIDNGLYLLIPLIFLAAFGLRRGWLGIVVLAVLPLGSFYTPESYAAEEKPQVKFNDRWRQIYLTGDQRGYQAWEKEDYIAAEIEFDNPQWQAAALYKQQKYAEALELFEQDSSAEGFYNQGNSLAHLGRLREAQEAYAEALKLNPNLSEAQKNKEIIDDLLDEPEEQQQPPETGDASDLDTEPQQEPQEEMENQPDDPAEQDPLEEDESDSNTDAGEQGAGSDEGEELNEQTTKEEALENISQTESENPLAEEDKDMEPSAIVAEDDATEEEQETATINHNEADQALENWLNQVEDNPGIFLQRKFDYQYQNRLNKPAKKTQKLW